MAAEILVGTCNWADHKPFYPTELERGTRQREKLTYYARFFPLVEIDTSFYGIPKPPVVESWVARTPPGFQFNIKAYRSLTRHEREGDGRERRPTHDEERDFAAALLPLRESGKLRAVHYQFPPWFTNQPRNRDVLVEARERHPGDIIAIEFRHRSWFGPRWPETVDILRELDAVFVAVDAPQVGSGTAPPILEVTSPRLCIVRFHGRNVGTWYKRTETSGERFDYLYRPAELDRWISAMREVSSGGTPVHALLNNNRANYAVVNAFDLGRRLGRDFPDPPEAILTTMAARARADQLSEGAP